MSKEEEKNLVRIEFPDGRVMECESFIGVYVKEDEESRLGIEIGNFWHFDRMNTVKGLIVNHSLDDVKKDFSKLLATNTINDLIKAENPGLDIDPNETFDFDMVEESDNEENAEK